MNNATQQTARPKTDDYLAFFSTEADCLTAAAEMLKKAGFIHYQTSLRSEAAYYRYPGRSSVLRLSSHKHSGKSFGLTQIASHLTINFRGGQIAVRALDIENRVAVAIGYYFLRCGAGGLST